MIQLIVCLLPEYIKDRDLGSIDSMYLRLKFFKEVKALLPSLAKHADHLLLNIQGLFVSTAQDIKLVPASVTITSSLTKELDKQIGATTLLSSKPFIERIKDLQLASTDICRHYNNLLTTQTHQSQLSLEFNMDVSLTQEVQKGIYYYSGVLWESK